MKFGLFSLMSPKFVETILPRLFFHGNDIISNLLYPFSFFKFCSFNRNAYLRYNHENKNTYLLDIQIDNTDPQVTGVQTLIVSYFPQNHVVDCRLPFRKSKFEVTRSNTIRIIWSQLIFTSARIKIHQQRSLKKKTTITRYFRI